MVFVLRSARGLLRARSSFMGLSFRGDVARASAADILLGERLVSVVRGPPLTDPLI